MAWDSLEFYTCAPSGTHPSSSHMNKHKHNLVDILVLHVCRVFAGSFSPPPPMVLDLATRALVENADFKLSQWELWPLPFPSPFLASLYPPLWGSLFGPLPSLTDPVSCLILKAFYGGCRGRERARVFLIAAFWKNKVRDFLFFPRGRDRLPSTNLVKGEIPSCLQEGKTGFRFSSWTSAWSCSGAEQRAGEARQAGRWWGTEGVRMPQFVLVKCALCWGLWRLALLLVFLPVRMPTGWGSILKSHASSLSLPCRGGRWWDSSWVSLTFQAELTSTRWQERRGGGTCLRSTTPVEKGDLAAVIRRQKTKQSLNCFMFVWHWAERLL